MNKARFLTRMMGFLLLTLAFYACKPGDVPTPDGKELSYTVDGKSFQGGTLTAVLDTTTGSSSQLLSISDGNGDYYLFIYLAPGQVGSPFQAGWTLDMGPGLGTELNMGLVRVNKTNQQLNKGFGEPEGTLTFTQFDPTNKVFSLTFDAKLYGEDLEDSLLLKGSITDLAYTLQ